MGVRRSQLLDAYEQLIDSLTRNRRKNLEGQFDLFSLGQEKPEPVELVLRDLPEFSQEELMTMEKEVTGLYLSGHPMDAYRDTVRAQGAVPIASVLEDFAQEEGPTQFQDGQRILLAGVVAAAKTKTTKNNSLMAYVTVEDDTATRVRNLFVLFPGQQTAVLYLADSKRRLGARCLLHPALLQELKELLGEENVVLQ